MRLTSLVIDSSPRVINPEGKLTLQLRSLQIPFIENLGITEDKYDVIDLTDNEIIELGGIPLNFTNLLVLLLGNNYVTTIGQLPQCLQTISLMNNNIKSFDVSWQKLTSVTNLCLINNPICKLKYYRLFVIWLIPSLKVLDFEKVTDKERKKSRELFGDDTMNELALSVLNNKSLDDKLPIQSIVNKLTDEERKTLLFKLETANSIDEITEIEAALKKGDV